MLPADSVSVLWTVLKAPCAPAGLPALMRWPLVLPTGADEELPGPDLVRAAVAVSPLLAAGWLTLAGDPPRLAVSRWARIVLVERIPRRQHFDRGKLEAAGPALPRHYSDDDRVKTLVGSDWVYRERHRVDCPCLCCAREVSGTKPRFAGPCPVCKGLRLPPLWECLVCGRGGRDWKWPPLPRARPIAPAPPPATACRKAGRVLKGGRA